MFKTRGAHHRDDLRRRKRRGGVLLEVVIALGLFVAAGVFALGSMRSAASAMTRSAREAIAMDLARSKLAELEAGVITLAELREREGVLDTVGSMSFDDEEAGTTWRGREWIVEIETERTEFAGLTLVELTVREADAGFGGGMGSAGAGGAEGMAGWGDEYAVSPDEPIEVTVRQLIRLREDEADEFEEDDLLEGLPMGEGAR